MSEEAIERLRNARCLRCGGDLPNGFWADHLGCYPYCSAECVLYLRTTQHTSTCGYRRDSIGATCTQGHDHYRAIAQDAGLIP